MKIIACLFFSFACNGEFVDAKPVPAGVRLLNQRVEAPGAKPVPPGVRLLNQRVEAPDAKPVPPGVRLLNQRVEAPDAKPVPAGVRLLNQRIVVPDAILGLFVVGGVKLVGPVQEKRTSVLSEDTSDAETTSKPLLTEHAAGFPTIERDSQIFLLLQSPDIRQGMEIVKVQEIELDALKNEFDSKLRKIEADFVAANPGEQPALVRKAFDELNAYEEGVKEILEPQWGNLQKSLFRSFLEENGLVAALLNPGIGIKVGISPEQQEELREDLKKITEKVEKELEEIQKGIVLEVVSKLSQKQKDEICAAAGLRDIEEINTGNFLTFLSRLRQATNSNCCGNILLNK